MSKHKKKNPKKTENQFIDQIHLNAAGIDIGSQVHYVAVVPGRDPESNDVRSFASFTPDLYDLANWLKVQYLRYAQFLRISRTDNYSAFFEIAQALILSQPDTRRKVHEVSDDIDGNGHFCICPFISEPCMVQ